MAESEFRPQPDDFPIHPEYTIYAETGILPDHFQEAEALFPELLKDDGFYNQYRDKFVALMGASVIGNDQDQIELLRRLHARFGTRPIFTDLVTREPQTKVFVVHPRITSGWEPGLKIYSGQILWDAESNTP